LENEILKKERIFCNFWNDRVAIGRSCVSDHRLETF